MRTVPGTHMVLPIWRFPARDASSRLAEDFRSFSLTNDEGGAAGGSLLRMHKRMWSDSVIEIS